MNQQTLSRLSFWQIWNMSFGFFGIQFGWGLQMANMSAIYQYLGASESDIPILWLAAPMTGFLVQPILGYYSDRTWTRLGRRRPYFLVGAILASLALIAMPNSSTLWMAAGLLWILDASVNVSMEPFRAFAADLLPPEQRKQGFAMQSLLIGFGAVLSSSLPWILSNVFNVVGNDEGSAIPKTVHYSFYVGAFVFFFAVLYTVMRTKEHPPADMEAFLRHKRETAGVFNAFKGIFKGLFQMPHSMKRLALVQFFTWLALFSLWIYFTPSITHTIYHALPGSPEYQAGVEWGGVCFATYNGVAFFFSFVLLWITRYFSARHIHMVCLCICALGLLSVLFIKTPALLILSMIAVGIGWASILSMPYAILSNTIPSSKMGYYMGVFNIFIVLPQMLAALGLGTILERLLGGETIYALGLGGASLLLAAFLLRFVREPALEQVIE
ncbi:MAG: MFS transporter [Opitutales bacterium]|nr:MFS transporter [Opitutales bacterium]